MGMLDTLYFIKAKLRQWAYPPEFRIQIDWESQWAERLGAALSQALSLAKSQAAKIAELNTSGQSLNLVNPDFVISLCNDHFRLRRNAQQMQKEGHDSKELRSIGRALENVDHLLEKNNIQCLDLTGEPYDDGRNDFDPLGEAEKIPGLNEKTILRCERPAIWLQGKLIQKAKGIVARPV